MKSQIPETSPYLSPPYILVIGKDEKEYSIPLQFLQNHPKLISSHNAYSPYNHNRTIRANNIDDDVGHTLVHFLYTGAYGTLKGHSSSHDPAVEYRRSVFTYCAASFYDLPGLIQHAQSQMMALARDVPIRSVLEVANEAFPKLPEEDRWFVQQHLKSRTEVAFHEDNAQFSYDSVLGLVTEAELVKVLLKITVDLFMEKDSAINDKDDSSFVKVPRESEECRRVFTPEVESEEIGVFKEHLPVEPDDQKSPVHEEATDAVAPSDEAWTNQHICGPLPTREEEVSTKLDGEIATEVADLNGKITVEVVPAVESSPDHPTYGQPLAYEEEVSTKPDLEITAEVASPDEEPTVVTIEETVSAPTEEPAPAAPTMLSNEASFRLDFTSPIKTKKNAEKAKRMALSKDDEMGTSCEFFVEHFGKGGAWKDCPNCQSIIRQYASELES